MRKYKLRQTLKKCSEQVRNWIPTMLSQKGNILFNRIRTLWSIFRHSGIQWPKWQFKGSKSFVPEFWIPLCNQENHSILKPKTLLLIIQKKRESILEKAMLVSGVLLGQITVAKKNTYSGWTAWVILLAPCKGINWMLWLTASPGPLGIMAEWFIKEKWGS